MSLDLKRILPSKASFSLAMFLYVVPLSIDLFFRRAGGGGPFTGWRPMFLVFLALLYGVSRAVMSHPVTNRGYGAWLATTPWTPDRPLPFGPVWLSVKDLTSAVVLLLVGCLNVVVDPWLLKTRLPVFHPLTLVACALFAYLAVLCVALAMGKRWLAAIVCLFALPLTVYPVFNPYSAMVVLLLMYVLCYVELRRSLAGFPWNTSYWERDVGEAYRKAAINMRVVGWPFRELTAWREDPEITAGMAVLITALVSWWVHVIARLGNVSVGPGLVGTVAVILAFGRMVAYTGKRWPPIGFFGRIFTLRWIIPAYDRVFLAPIAIFLVPTVFFPLLAAVGLTGHFAAVAVLALTIFASLTLPPSLYHWHLTGPHRCVNMTQQQTVGPTGDLRTAFMEKTLPGSGRFKGK